MLHQESLTLIKVTLNGEVTYYTYSAYIELRLQMSTGDFHVHERSIVVVDASTPHYRIGLEGMFLREGN